MIKKNDLEKANERAKKRAKDIFRPAPPEIEKELKKEKTLGTPKNLVRPDNKNE
ncbi:MAG: hypothetical protein V4732_12850 [Pseudomonadota bacterium]